MKRLIYASSFNRAIEHMNTKQCGFITAFRHQDSQGNLLSNNENRRRNKELETDIKKSGLTYIKCKGGFIEDKGTEHESRVTEDTFCVINNRFSHNDFTKLMIAWCAKYEQEAVLVTTPVPQRAKNGQPLVNKPINVIGTYWSGEGKEQSTFNNATVQDAEEYFTNICGKDFVLSATELNETNWPNNYSATGRALGINAFKKLYPDL